MKTMRLRQQAGFTLLEAAIAVGVLGIGVVGLLALNGVLLKDTGEAKARAEAVQLAEDYFEASRRIAGASGCENLPTVQPVTGVNANFSLSIVTDPATPDADTTEVDMAVCVTWNGVNCVMENGNSENQMVLASIVNCSGSAIPGSGLVASAESLLPPFKTPTGRGKIGGREDQYPALNPAPDENTIPDSDLGDGTYTYVTDDGRVELLKAKYDTDGNADGYEVLLGFDQLCDDEDFSVVSGKVFIEMKNGDPIINEPDLFVLGSDASYCALLPYDLDHNVLGDEAYLYVEYQCYFAPEWWGNVGVIRTRNADLQDRVCVGNPTAPPTGDGTAYSTEPKLSTIRGYRADRAIGGGKYESVGIGYDEDSDADCDASDYTAVQIKDHQFVVAKLTGSDTCTTVEEAVVALDEHALDDNPGSYYCMLDGGCPDLNPSGSVSPTFVHGTISSVSASTSATDWPVLTAIDETGGVCKTKEFVDGPTDEYGNVLSYGYSCEIDWEGFSGDSWSGEIAFTAAESPFPATLCMANSTVAVTPNTETVDYVINDRFADLAGDVANAISFTDIPRAVTDVQLDFEVKADWCGVLGTPNVSWDYTLTPPASLPTLQWPAVFRADSYLIEKCWVDNENALTPCTPAPSSSETINADGSTEYAFEAPDSDSGEFDKKNTACVQVTAQYNGTSGTPGPVKCVYRGGNSYSYND